MRPPIDEDPLSAPNIREKTNASATARRRKNSIATNPVRRASSCWRRRVGKWRCASSSVIT
jgi:hypothetical protein